MRVRLGLHAITLGGILLLSPALRAQDQRDPASAEALFRQGRVAADKHDFATACLKFRESNRLDPAIGTVFNLADCEEKLGRLATSWTLFREVAQRLPNDDDRRAIARLRAEALEPRVPLLAVHLMTRDRADLVVRRDGVALGAASLDTALPVDPGEHVVLVEAPGTAPAQFRTRIREGEHARLDVSAGAELRGAGTEAARPLKQDTGRAGTPRTAAYLTGSVGLAGLATGLVAGLFVLQRRNTVDEHCQGHVCDQTGLDASRSGKALGVVTTVGFVTAALGLGTASYLFLSTPAPTERAQSGAYSVGIRAKW